MKYSETARLFVDGLAKLQPPSKELQSLEANYENLRKEVLSEDLFWSEDKDKIYRVMLELDTASSDYIKGLKKRLEERR